MRAQRIVGTQCLRHQIGPGRLHAFIHMLAVVAVRPAVKRAVFYRSQVVGHQIAANLVALIDHRPQGACAGRPTQAVRVAQARRKDAVSARDAVDLPDRGAAGFRFHAAFADVAVGAHRDIQLAAVRTCNDVFRPVVIDRPARQVEQFCRCRGNAGLAGLIGKADHGIRIGDIKIIADQRHAKRRVQVRKEHRADFCLAIAIRIAQQRDAIGRRHAATGPAHDFFHHPRPDALALFSLGWCIALGHQHVAVGQHINPARMIEPGGQRRYRETSHWRRHDTCGPSLGRGNVDCGNQPFGRRRQFGVSAGLLRRQQHRRVAACGQAQQ